MPTSSHGRQLRERQFGDRRSRVPRDDRDVSDVGGTGCSSPTMAGPASGSFRRVGAATRTSTTSSCSTTSHPDSRGRRCGLADGLAQRAISSTPTSIRDEVRADHLRERGADARVPATPTPGPGTAPRQVRCEQSSRSRRGHLTYAWDLDGDGTYDDSPSNEHDHEDVQARGVLQRRPEGQIPTATPTPCTTRSRSASRRPGGPHRYAMRVRSMGGR